MLKNADKKKLFLFALFITCMIIVNTIGSKITTLVGIRVSVGIIFMPILFLVTDIVGEVYGRKEASFFVQTSTIMLIFMFVMIFLCIKMSPNPTWGLQEQYEVIFGSSMRMTAASIISFVISQNFDVQAFHFWKRVTKGKHLWIRNNLSTIVSQFIDTVIFMFIAFYRINPQYTAGFLFTLIIPYWAFKVVFALLDTPLCYLGVKWLRKGADIPTPDEKGNIPGEE